MWVVPMGDGAMKTHHYSINLSAKSTKEAIMLQQNLYHTLSLLVCKHHKCILIN